VIDTEKMRVLIGVDGSENALRAVKLVGNMTAKLEAKVTLLNVIAPSEAALFSGKSSRPLEERTIGDERLHAAVKILEQAGVEYETAVEFGHPADAILNYANKGYDLVAVGSRGLSSIEGFLMGSVSSKVVHHSKVPTLVVP
jgi:nucleotide-binding universal stress UspA family protein